MVELSLGQTAGDAAQVGYAGDTLNTAIYLKRCLGERASVAYVSALGDDPLSERMIEFMQSEHVSTDHIKRLTGRLPGLYAINTDPSGERTFSYWRSESAARSLFRRGQNTDFSALGQFDVLYLSAITLAILPAPVRPLLLGELRRLRDTAGRHIVFDSNYRPRLWEDTDTARSVVSEAWRTCSIALPSVDDEMQLFGDPDEQAVLNRLRGHGVREGALKRGSEGPLSLSDSPDPAAFTPSVTTVDVVDTTAAGDSFNAGYLAAHLGGQSDHEALKSGHELACRVIAHRGAIIPADAPVT